MTDEHEPPTSADTDPPADDEPQRLFGIRRDRVEFISTIVLSLAVIAVAWSAFQSGKWSGVQAIAFSEAGANRVESTRFDTQAGQQTQIDVALFVDWVSAVSEETAAGREAIRDGEFIEEDLTLSTFLFRRMRPEFRPALDAWLATDPVNNPDAPSSPFAMEEYVLDAAVEAERLQDEAEAKSAEAREANQIGDSYVLTAVVFATVLFFGGVAPKLVRPWSRRIAAGLAILFFVAGTWTLFNLPVELGNELFFLGI
jgi:predicted nicotinamide N-methyase